MSSARRTPLLVVAFGAAAIVVALSLWFPFRGAPASAAQTRGNGANADEMAAKEPALAPSAPDAARADDEARLKELDAADPALSFERKYEGCDAHRLELAHTRIGGRLETRSGEILDALLAAGATRKVKVQPGEVLPESEGSIARKSRAEWQPYGITELDVAEFDRAADPRTKALWDELMWLAERLDASTDARQH